MNDVLVLGGYGTFGRRIVELLARQGIAVVVAGRDLARAESLSKALHPSPVRGVRLDVGKDLAAYLSKARPKVVINTVGPFQGQDYGVARTCMAAGVHYVDIADGRDYVTGIGALDAEARQGRSLVISGASTVPALTGAVIEHLLAGMKRIDGIDFGISPGARTERGLATTRAILSYVGRPLRQVPGNPVRYGWQDLHQRDYPGLGARWMANCDVPDLDLLPERYGIRRVRFAAGMEVPVLHWSVWLLSWAVRIGLPIKLERFAASLLALSHMFDPFGSGNGGMHVIADGIDENGRSQTCRWYVVARDGHGPYIPCVAAVVVAKRILTGSLSGGGAMPCLGLMSLDAFLHELRHLKVETYEFSDLVG